MEKTNYLQDLMKILDCFFVSSPAGLCLFDKDCRYININDTLADYAQRSREEHIGKKPSDLLPSELAEYLEGIVFEIFKTGQPHINQFFSRTIPYKAEKGHWGHSLFPIKISTGEIIAVGAIVVEETDLKKAHEAIRIVESYHKTLLEAIPQRIFFKDIESNYIYCNELFARDLNIHREDVVGKTDFDFFSLELAEKYRADDRKIVSTLNDIETDESYCVEGLEYVVHTKKSLVRDNKGNLIGILGIFHDITNQKRLENERKKALEHWQNIFATVHLSIAVMDKDFNFIKVNNTYAQADNKTPDFFVGKNHFDLYPNEENEAIFRKVVENREGFSVFAKPFLFPGQNELGITYWNWTLNPIKDIREKVSELVLVLQDVTEAKRAEFELKEREALYRTLFNTSSDGISLTKRSKDLKCIQLIDCNESYVRLSGLSKEQLLQTDDIGELQRVCDDKGSDSVENKKKCKVCSEVYSWNRPDNKVNYIECRGGEIQYKGQEVMHCIHRDITNSILSDMKVKSLSRRLSAITEEERRRIARDLHDEFGQLTPGFNEICHLYPQFEDTVSNLGQIIRKAIHQLRPDILDNLGLREAMKWTLHDFETRHSGVKVVFNTYGLNTDPSLEYSLIIYRIFQEIMNNIVKHSKAKNITVTLTSSYPLLILIVTDDGIGFDTDVLYSQDLGIGLKGISERLLAVDGNLKISSKKGDGTIIRAELTQKKKAHF